MTDLPFISIIIPTLNSARTLNRCLKEIWIQDYPKESVEVLICDGGSCDGTRAIAQGYQAGQILENPLKTGEAGKALGLRNAKGDLVAFIDSDNFVIGSDWLRRMVAPFQEDPEVVMSEPLYFHWDPLAPPITRYCALMGMNDPLCYYTGNFDRWNVAAEKWTGIPISTHDEGDWVWFELGAEDRMPTLGANGTIYRRKVLIELPLSNYLFDVDVPHLLVNQKPQRFAKVRCAILHWYCPTFPDFVRKQKRRICDYLSTKQSRLRTGHQKSYSRSGTIRFILATLLIFPCAKTSLQGFFKKRDVSWFLHWPLCLSTLVIYAISWVHSFWVPVTVSRTDWQKS